MLNLKPFFMQKEGMRIDIQLSMFTSLYGVSEEVWEKVGRINNLGAQQDNVKKVNI